MAGECLDSISRNEIQNAAAKSTAHHSSAKPAGGILPQLDECIEFMAAHFVIVSKTVVGGRQNSADFIKCALRECGRELAYTLVFTDHMPEATLQGFLAT